ncbi:MAG: peptidase M28, partial [Peptococcia bacterium]
MNSIDMIQQLCQSHGPSGYEGPVKELIRTFLQGEAEFSQDNLGSLICRKKGSADSPRIMIPGHIDEIGFMVNSITEKGFIKFFPLGGWWDQVLLAQKVIVKTAKGDLVGVIGSVPPHMLSAKEKERVVEKKAMFIDIGARSKDEALEMGVQLGDPIVPDTSFHALGQKGMYMGKALDNRLGCTAFIEVIKALQDEDHPNTVYGVGTVQEEVGLRGATTASNLVQPDICFVVDVTIATDTPGLEKESSEVKLGQGPVLT